MRASAIQAVFEAGRLCSKQRKVGGSTLSRKHWFIGMIVVLILAVSACGGRNAAPSGGSSQQTGSSQAEPEPQQQESEQQEEGALEKTSLVVGSTVRDIGMLPLYVADQQGFFTEEGLDVTVQYFDGSRPAAQALAAGAIDIGSGGYTEALDAYVAKQPVIAFWGLANYPIYEWWSAPEIKTLDDIRERGRVKVAISSIGALSHLISIYAFQKAGIDPEQHVDFLALGGPGSRLAALQSGQVDIIPATPPGNYILAEDGYNQLIRLKDLMEEFQYEVHYAPIEFLENNPNTVRAFLRAISKATDSIRQDPEAAAKILQDVVGYTPEQLEDTIRGVKEMADYFPADGHFAEEGVEVLLQFYKESGDLDEIPDHSEVLYYKFTNEFQGK